MKLAIIAALTDDRVIGKDNRLPWRLPADLRRFKRLTVGHPVIMGRRTWESLPSKPLPDRPNIVLSHNADFHAEGAQTFTSMQQAIDHLAPLQEESFVIGGAALFAEALPIADRLHLTLIHHPFEGDVSFPEIDFSQWRETARERGIAAEGWEYEFVDWVRSTPL